MKNIFTKEMLSGLEWMQVVSRNTAGGIYRVDVRWVLDRYRIQVWRSFCGPLRFDFETLKLVWGGTGFVGSAPEPEKFVDQHDAYYLRTAVKTANALLRAFEKREAI